jgi:hypothetical protein
MPVIGGVGVIVGVLEGVGEGTVAEGVNVNVGSGVRDGTGVAVSRGVALTSGESVFVGIPPMAVGCSVVVQLAMNTAISTIGANERSNCFGVIGFIKSHLPQLSAQISREMSNTQNGLPHVCPALRLSKLNLDPKGSTMIIYSQLIAAVAQRIRALAYGAIGRGFESLQPHKSNGSPIGEPF